MRGAFVHSLCIVLYSIDNRSFLRSLGALIPLLLGARYTVVDSFAGVPPQALSKRKKRKER